MRWLSVEKDGLPNYDERVLAYSPTYKNNPELKFRLMDGQFVRLCKEITHYIYISTLEDEIDV